MNSFSDDRDILKYEPMLFTDLYMAGQVLVKGAAGTLSGTTFSKTGAGFISAGVKAGHVIFLSSSVMGISAGFEIVSVDSETELTISILRSDVSGNAISPNSDETDYQYRIATFDPQAKEIMFQLTQYYSIAPGNPDSDYSADDLLDSNVLRQMSTFGIISLVYASKATGLDQEDAYWDKSHYYGRKFAQARARCRVDIDLGSDGVKDLTRYAGSPKLLRT